MKNILTILILILISNYAMSQKITYSSAKVYYKINLSKKYPFVAKNTEVENQEIKPQTPFINTKKVIYGTLADDKK